MGDCRVGTSVLLAKTVLSASVIASEARRSPFLVIPVLAKRGRDDRLQDRRVSPDGRSTKKYWYLTPLSSICCRVFAKLCRKRVYGTKIAFLTDTEGRTKIFILKMFMILMLNKASVRIRSDV